jgi:hypothetical protein
MTSDETVGPIDVKKLLKLLNNSESEDGAALGNQGETLSPLSQRGQSVEKMDHQKALTAAQAEPAAPDTAVPDDVENRFAAHIVHGMSKLKAR